MADSQLPEQFADLRPYLAWAEPTEVGRNARRWSATLEESRAFYAIMHQRGADALEYLGQFALEDIAGPDLNLLNMCLALAECAATIEMYEDPRPQYVFPIERFVPVHDTWNTASKGSAR
ncbi:hypothetical protein H7F50_00270 [Novosphingobium flavum]|uniref:hypothetical protein n=1 Tax=Novosphingobium aerophilum TaxID=2839843 RepID=UPI00163AB323|nr:hypothetical protein [Novosphingobium aerophilum]MBC2660171.1 hypothetical protein [Novosphingobium aerophilum]